MNGMLRKVAWTKAGMLQRISDFMQEIVSTLGAFQSETGSEGNAGVNKPDLRCFHHACLPPASYLSFLINSVSEGPI